MKLRITGGAVKGVAMTTNDITNIHKENVSSGFELWGAPNTKDENVSPAAIITAGYVRNPHTAQERLKNDDETRTEFTLLNCIIIIWLHTNVHTY